MYKGKPLLVRLVKKYPCDKSGTVIRYLEDINELYNMVRELVVYESRLMSIPLGYSLVIRKINLLKGHVSGYLD